MQKTVSRSKTRVYRKVSPEEWAQAKSDYESGMYTMPEIAAKYGNITTPNLDRHIRRYGWQKGKDLPLLQANVTERNRRILEKAGITDALLAKILLRGLTEPVCVAFEGKGEAMQATPQPDYKTILDYLKECNKLKGAYQPGGPQAQEGDKHVHLHISEASHDKSPQESLTEYLQAIRQAS